MKNVRGAFPVVSVILPVWNGEAYIAEAVESILAQTLTDFELLVIDNASSDETPRILAGLAKRDARVRVLTNPENLGMVGSLNRGLAESRGVYVARMDADDVALPERFAEQVDYLERHPEVVAVSCWAEKFGGESGVIRMAGKPACVRARSLFVSPLVHPGAMLRMATLREHGIAYVPVTPVEDFSMWTRLLAVGELAVLEKVLLRYRVVGTSLTARSTEARRARLRGVLKLGLTNFLARHGWQDLVNDTVVELHARFAGHEKMTAREYAFLPFWLFFLLVSGARLSLALVLVNRVFSYVWAALRGRLVEPPASPVFELGEIRREIL